MKNKGGCGITLLAFGALIVLFSLSEGSIGGAMFALIIGGLGAMMIYDANADKRVEEEANAGKYVTGLPSIESFVRNVKILINENEVLLHQVQRNLGWKNQPILSLFGSIPLQTIIDVQMENRSVIERRYNGMVGMRLGLGLLAVPVQSSQLHELCYVVITCRDGKFDRHIIFEFEGPSSSIKASALTNAIIKAANFISSDMN